METIEEAVRILVREELMRISEVSHVQDPSGRWTPDEWVAESEPAGACGRSCSCESCNDEAARVKKRKYKGKTYKASAGSLGGDIHDIESFKWAENPWAAKQAATIVKTGRPIGRGGRKGK